MRDVYSMITAFFLLRGLGWMFKILWWLMLLAAAVYAFFYIVLPLLCLAPLVLAGIYEYQNEKNLGKKTALGAAATSILFSVYLFGILPWFEKGMNESNQTASTTNHTSATNSPRSFTRRLSLGDALTVNTTSGLYLRSGPGTQYDKITLLPYGTTIYVERVEATETISNITAPWVFVNTPEGDGYIFAGFVQ
jgi:hypothetical protein